MFRIIALLLLSCFGSTLAETCYTYSGGIYYCSLGQTCGSYYGDCRGLSTYVIMAIVFSSITLLSICIRCCIHCSSQNNSARPVPVTRVINPGARGVPGRPVGQNYASTGSSVQVAIHGVTEAPPPSYTSAVSAKDQYPKY